MKTAGIIAEYNPFHNGHAWQIAQARRILGNDCVFVAAMSGSFTQRGEPALLDKWDRARAAIDCGVSLVIELPHVFATASAERFAAGGVQTLAASGIVQTLVFGSESGDITRLEQLAAYLHSESDNYKVRLKDHLSMGLSFPAARQKAIAVELGEETAGILTRSNNILAVEYLKALRNLPAKSKFEPLTIPRMGQDYNDTTLKSGVGHASAGAIRLTVAELTGTSGIDPLRKEPDTAQLIVRLSGQMPVPSLAILMAAVHGGSSLVLPEDMAVQVLTMLRSLSPEDLSHIVGMQEGLAARLSEAARRPVMQHNASQQTAARLSSLLEQADTRRFPRTRIQRALLSMLMQIRQDDAACTLAGPQYLRILAFDKKGRHLLKLMRKYATLPIITRASDFLEFKRDSLVFRQAEKDLLATDMRSLAAGGTSGADFDTEVLIR